MAQQHTSHQEPRAAAVPFLGAFESTYLPGHDLDVLETTGHLAHWRRDLDADIATGVGAFRYPLPWHRIEAQEGRYDWRATDEALEHLRARAWSRSSTCSTTPATPPGSPTGCGTGASPAPSCASRRPWRRRYPWLDAYTVVNEPFATTFLAGHEALWPPYGRGVEAFVRVLASVLPAVSEAAAVLRELLPRRAARVGRHLRAPRRRPRATPGVTPTSPTTGASPCSTWSSGTTSTTGGPFSGSCCGTAGRASSTCRRCRSTMLGLDYYCHSEWWYDDAGRSLADRPTPSGSPPWPRSTPSGTGCRSCWPRPTSAACRRTERRGCATCWSSTRPRSARPPAAGVLLVPAGRLARLGLAARAAGGTDRPRRGARARAPTARAGAPPSPTRGRPPRRVRRSADLPAVPVPAAVRRAARGLRARSRRTGPGRTRPTTRPSPADPTSRPRGSPNTMTRPDRPGPPGPTSSCCPTCAGRGCGSDPSTSSPGSPRDGPRAGARTWFVEEPEVGDVAEPRLATEEADGVTRVRLLHPRARRRPRAPPGLRRRGRRRLRRRSCATSSRTRGVRPPRRLAVHAHGPRRRGGARRRRGWSTTSWTTSPRSRTRRAGWSCGTAASSPRRTSSSPAAAPCTAR